jgi:release factor glutamine methyltransferase
VVALIFKVALDVVQDRFASSLRSRLCNAVDLIVFNPPYVVTTAEEVESAQDIAFSWAGGVDGRQVIDDLFQSGLIQVSRVLTGSRNLF